jgi:uncharacterized RDD family membrane protein YckC
MQVNIQTMKSNKKIILQNRSSSEHSLSEPMYAGFHSRAIAAMIDCTLIAIIFFPLFTLLSNIIFGNTLPADVLNTASQEIVEITKSGKNISFMEFINSNSTLKEYFITQHGLIKVLTNQLLQLIIIVSVFLYFWIKKQATPGKMFLAIKIVDAKTLGKPTKKQLVIRMFSYIISAVPLLLGIIWISFDPKKQGWHDKIASTLVIKEEKKSK